MSDRDSPLGEGVHVLRATLAELQAAREVVEAARKVANRGPIYVSELREALLRYDIQRGNVTVEEDDGTP